MDFYVDTHMHTLASGHAYNTFEEMKAEAFKKGMDVICLTDHGPAMPGSAHEFYFTNMRIIHDHFHPDYPENPMEPILIKGFEANILDYQGNTDYDTLNDRPADLKYIIASFHPCCIEPGTCAENTSAYIGAVKKPYVMALGHIDDGRIPCDYEAVIRCAKENDVLVELNNSSLSPNSFRENAQKNAEEYLSICKELGAIVVLGSDAHYKSDIGNFENVLPILERVKFPEELIINERDKFLAWVEKKYAKRLELEKRTNVV